MADGSNILGDQFTILFFFFLRTVWSIDEEGTQIWFSKSIFNIKNPLNLSKKNFLLKNINLGATFLFLSILCSIKIERLLFLKFLKNLAFFDSYFWPFNKFHEKTNAIFVISAIMASIWNVFIKFRWHDEKLTAGSYKIHFSGRAFVSICFHYFSQNLGEGAVVPPCPIRFWRSWYINLLYSSSTDTILTCFNFDGKK